jgi:hypothetical protein
MSGAGLSWVTSTPPSEVGGDDRRAATSGPIADTSVNRSETCSVRWTPCATASSSSAEGTDRPAAFSVAARSQASTAAEMPSLSDTDDGSTHRPSASSYANTRPEPARTNHLKPVSVSAWRAPWATAT